MEAALAVPAKIKQTDEERVAALVDRARDNLAAARSAAEVLDARDLATKAYDEAKRLARLAAARDAFDELLPRIHRAQADALGIEAAAKRRLADEYDAAQARGEVKGHGHKSDVPNWNVTPNAAQAGLSRKAIHEARQLRDAERTDPGMTQRTLETALDAGKEPSKALLRRAVEKTVKPAKTEAQMQGDAQRHMQARIWSDLRAALEKLSGMPRPADVAAIASRKTFAPIVEQHLAAANTWLKEFNHVWTERHVASAKED